MGTTEQYEHLGPREREVVLLGREERLQYLDEPVWISYTRAQKVITLLEDLMKYPKRPRMKNLLIIGESNNGKTSIVYRFKSLHPDLMVEDSNGIAHTQKPVIVAKMPTGAAENRFYLSILSEFWKGVNPSDSIAKLHHQVRHQMLQHDVKILILDEIHNILQTTTIKQRLMMDAIKNLGNELMIPIVLVGTDRAARVLGGSAELASRFDVARLPAWDADEEFKGLLKGFEKKLPLKYSSKLYRGKKVKLLRMFSKGNIGNLHTLLAACAADAIMTGEECITEEVIIRNKDTTSVDMKKPREILL